MPESIEASERMLSDWNKSIQERAERYQAMAERVQSQTITETSRDGAVTVTIGSNGILTSLTIAESAQSKRMSELSAQIMATVQRAQSRIPELLQQAMAETIGTQDQTAAKLFEDAKKNFPQPPDDEPPSRSQPPREMQFGPADDTPPSGPPFGGTPPSRPQPPRGPQPPRRPPRDDDEDFGDGSIMS
jgi:DNA-binding protein YbaB